MRNTRNSAERSCRKQITFDLSDAKLKEIYPCPDRKLRPQYYKKAWKDIAQFMIANGFEHRQYSVYNSKREMTGMEVYALVKRMSKNMPWLRKCLNVIDVTDIGEVHDLMPFVEEEDFEFEGDGEFDLEQPMP